MLKSLKRSAVALASCGIVLAAVLPGLAWADWTGSTGANSADGTGCLAKRNTSGKILP